MDGRLDSNASVAAGNLTSGQPADEAIHALAPADSSFARKQHDCEEECANSAYGAYPLDTPQFHALKLGDSADIVRSAKVRTRGADALRASLLHEAHL
ncbi:hypothetical protein NQ156_06820 [Microbacterium sp. zg.Y625]|uniref:hypothetical protein n=1 Tax=Microbacterium jiangjiandongii TaxID=3049071 RepID=UPI00214AFDE4|nr:MULTISPECIES: hypothetical protein [unclassified Microbacterium]MCR2792774.1 hypothetical protein [Microbacterium sp. zg.Y625]WIM26750.1 hypothetical protein QNO14_06845 [Microbacterium sp. zg-Y625]